MASLLSLLEAKIDIFQSKGNLRLDVDKGRKGERGKEKESIDKIGKNDLGVSDNESAKRKTFGPW